MSLFDTCQLLDARWPDFWEGLQVAAPVDEPRLTKLLHQFETVWNQSRIDDRTSRRLDLQLMVKAIDERLRSEPKLGVKACIR